MSFPNTIHASYSSQLHTLNIADARYPFGQKAEYEDGRKFRFGLVGGTTLVMGDLIQGKAIIAGDSRLAVQTAAVAGDTTLSITAQGTAAANFYAKGWMWVNKPTLTGGYVYKVKSHPVFAAATKVITLETDTPIRLALDTSAEVSFIPNEYDGLIVCPVTTLSNRCVGVACTPITTLYYGFIQSGGVCGVNCATTMVIGNYVGTVLATSGRAEIGSTDIDANIGIALSTMDTAGEATACHLFID